MKALMLAIAMVFVLFGGEPKETITRDSTWQDEQGCYHTRTSTWVDSTWVKSDSVLVRCPNKVEGMYWDIYSY